MTQNVQTKKRWPWWLRLILYLSPLWIILAIVLSVEMSGRRAYNRAMQEARDIGGPVTIEEIEAARKVWPDDENGAFIILEVIPRLPDFHRKGPRDSLPLIGEGKEYALGEKWPAQVLQDVDSYLADMSGELHAIDRLIAFTGGRFPVTHQLNPLDTQYSHLRGLRTSAKLKMLQVVRYSMTGNVASLVPDLQVIALHGRLLDDEPSIISSLVHVAVDALMIDTLQQVMAQLSLGEGQLHAIESSLAFHDVEDRLAWGLLGERATMIGAAQWLRSPNGERQARAPGLRGWLLHDEATAIRLWGSVVASGRGTDRLRVNQAIDAQVQSLPRRYLITRTLVHPFVRSVQLDLKATGVLRSAMVALAVERYRLDKGRFPARLEELVPQYMPALLTDPFDDKPLRYQVTDDAVIIYSIGEDGVDDGGYVTHRIPPGTSPTDWGFVLLKPEFRGRPASTTAPATQEAEATAVSTDPAR